MNCGILTCLEHRYADSHDCKNKNKKVNEKMKNSKLLDPDYFKKE